jgi:hypothetical protein
MKTPAKVTAAQMAIVVALLPGRVSQQPQPFVTLETTQRTEIK